MLTINNIKIYKVIVKLFINITIAQTTTMNVQNLTTSPNNSHIDFNSKSVPASGHLVSSTERIDLHRADLLKVQPSLPPVF